MLIYCILPLTALAMILMLCALPIFFKNSIAKIFWRCILFAASLYVLYMSIYDIAGGIKGNVEKIQIKTIENTMISTKIPIFKVVDDSNNMYWGKGKISANQIYKAPYSLAGVEILDYDELKQILKEKVKISYLPGSRYILKIESYFEGRPIILYHYKEDYFFMVVTFIFVAIMDFILFQMLNRWLKYRLKPAKKGRENQQNVH